MSSSGHRFAYWMPPVPRIRDAYLDCAIYLYASESDADAGARSGGSGFLVGIPTTDLPGNVWIIYAVTNKHVIEGGNSVVRLRTKSGKHSIMPIDERAWMFHQDGDDLSVCLIRFDWQSVQFNFVPRNVFLDNDTVIRYNIGPGDETFVVGRFINHEGRQQNLPTARFGCISQMPHEPVKQNTGFEQESFLVEARSIGGYSGSPVFVYIPIFSDRENVEDWYHPITKSSPDPITGRINEFKSDFPKSWGNLKAHGPWLLGIDWGHINDWQSVCDAAGRPVDRSGPPWNPQVCTNTGIMTVVPAWKLAALLDEGPVAEQRKEIIEQIRRYQETNSPSATSD
jgi:hypothetical protein